MFNYFGSKRTLAPTYQPPRHNIIIEPFAGSAQYACYWLTERPTLTAIILDTDPMVIASWKRILDATPDEIANWTIKVGDPVNDYIDLANYGGGNKIANDRIVERFYNHRKRWARTRAAIGSRLIVIEDDYTEAPDLTATWFIDPPYQHQGQTSYKHGSRSLDFAALGEWCQNRMGQVIVTEAEPADWLPFQHHKTTTALAGTSTELVWYNQVDPTLLDLIQ